MVERDFKEFEKKVSPANYALILKALKDFKPSFSYDLFELFRLSLERGEKMTNMVLKYFRKKPKNIDDMRKKIFRAKSVLEKRNW
jgi:hypothetical protein